MFIVKTSVRAFLVALLPLAALHVLLFANALGGQATSNQAQLPPPDRAFFMLALRLALDLGGLVAGHFLARSFKLGTRAAYALIGGCAAALGYTLAYRYGLMLHQPYEGAVVTAAILPTLTGMAAGFLYGQFAGRELLGARVAQVLANPATPQAVADLPQPAVEPAPVPPPPPATFEGPVQVRTSAAAIFLASVVPTLLITLICFTFMYPFLSGMQSEPGAALPLNWTRQVMAFSLPVQMLLITGMTTLMPCAILVAISHVIARGLKRTSGLHYAGVGALVGLGLGLALLPLTSGLFLLLAPPLAALGAIMMAVYRRFAGLEPRPLPEPVLATDRDALVPEHHPARRTHVVVLNG
jgi:hypothetical protein